MDEKWNLPGKGYIAAFYATGNDKKILSVSMSPRIEKFTEPSVYELLDKKEWQEAKKLGFEKMEVRHSDLTNTNLNF